MVHNVGPALPWDVVCHFHRCRPWPEGFSSCISIEVPQAASIPWTGINLNCCENLQRVSKLKQVQYFVGLSNELCPCDGTVNFLFYWDVELMSKIGCSVNPWQWLPTQPHFCWSFFSSLLKEETFRLWQFGIRIGRKLQVMFGHIFLTNVKLML